MFAKLKLIIEGISLVSSFLKTLSAMYESWQVKKIEKHYKAKKTAVRALNKKIAVESKKEVPSDEVIKELHRRIINITNNH